MGLWGVFRENGLCFSKYSIVKIKAKQSQQSGINAAQH